MIRERNQTPERWQPRRPPSGTANFGNLLRDPALAFGELVSSELIARGHVDARPALLAVAAHIAPEGSRITDLAARAQLTKATIVRTVDELELLGYVERVPDPDDGRAKRVVMTAHAYAVQEDAREIIAEIRDCWADLMEPGELDQLEQLLHKLRLALWPNRA